MGVRLNKVLVELNIGLQTAVDFLKLHKEIGEISDNANVNTKINDEQYDALVNHFRPRKQESRLLLKSQKYNPGKKYANVETEQKFNFTPLGKIDLENLDKKEEEKPVRIFTPLGKIDLDSIIAHKKGTENSQTDHTNSNDKKKYDVFVSYSRLDTNRVQAIVGDIEKKGYKVWIDKKGIDSGDEFKAVIVKAIKNSEVFLFFSSKGANESPWTIKEVNLAVYLKKIIIPVKLDKTEYNDSILFDMAGLDFVDFTDESRQSYTFYKLAAALRKKILNPVNSVNNKK